MYIFLFSAYNITVLIYEKILYVRSFLQWKRRKTATSTAQLSSARTTWKLKITAHSKWLRSVLMKVILLSLNVQTATLL